MFDYLSVFFLSLDFKAFVFSFLLFTVDRQIVSVKIFHISYKWLLFST